MQKQCEVLLNFDEKVLFFPKFSVFKLFRLAILFRKEGVKYVCER